MSITIFFKYKINIMHVKHTNKIKKHFFTAKFFNLLHLLFNSICTEKKF